MSAKTTRRFFSRETEVEVDIHAAAATVWALLTDGAAYPRWTSTVVSLEGKIAVGERLKLRSSLDPKRTFTLKVRVCEAQERLVWGDAMGQRTYELASSAPGVVRFRMHEKIGGPIFPLFASMIPPFDESFDRFAADLKKEAEARADDGPPRGGPAASA